VIRKVLGDGLGVGARGVQVQPVLGREAVDGRHVRDAHVRLGPGAARASRGTGRIAQARDAEKHVLERRGEHVERVKAVQDEGRGHVPAKVDKLLVADLAVVVCVGRLHRLEAELVVVPVHVIANDPGADQKPASGRRRILRRNDRAHAY
jgi:hypothetical protein